MYYTLTPTVWWWGLYFICCDVIVIDFWDSVRLHVPTLSWARLSRDLTSCCAPAKQCGALTISDTEREKETNNPQRKDYIITTRSNKYPWLHCQGVGPLQNRIKGAPMSTIWYRIGKSYRNQSQPNSHGPKTLPQLCKSTAPRHNGQHHSPP